VVVQCHLNESQITEHHPPLLLGLIHLPRVGLRVETGLRNLIFSSHGLKCQCGNFSRKLAPRVRTVLNIVLKNIDINSE